MATIATTGLLSSAGIGSGLDVNSIVSALVNVERVPITQLQKQADALQTKLSSFGKLQSYVSAVRDAARTLATPATWAQTVGTSSDAAAVAVSTGAAAQPGSHQVQVLNLASGQSVATAIGYANATTTLGQGTLHIELGNWTVSPPLPKPGASAVDVVIGAGEDTLEKVRDKINASNAGVIASILNDGSGARLVIRSRDSGALNGFRIGVTESGAAGLGALAYDPAGASSMTLTQAAKDASLSVDGMPVTSPGNTVADVVDGLTLTLLKPTTSPVEVGAKFDTEAMKKALTGFVSAYNDLAKFLTEQTKYDDASKTAGNLQGDSAALGVRGQMRALLAQSSAVATKFSRLSDIGFDVQTDGTISLKASRLDNALADVPELKKLLANTDLATPANNGLMTQLRELAGNLLSSDGTLTTRSDGLRKRVDLNKEQQSRLEDRVSAFEARVRAQYTALDRQMGQLNGLSNYVVQQMTLLNRNV